MFFIKAKIGFNQKCFYLSLFDRICILFILMEAILDKVVFKTCRMFILKLLSYVIN